VLDLRDTTQVKYRSIVKEHLGPRFANRRLDRVTADELALLVRDMHASAKSEATIAVALAIVGRVYKFAARRLGWNGTIPTTLMLCSERPKISQAKRRPIFIGEQLEQTIAAAHEPFRTLFAVAALTGVRVSELPGLTWVDGRIDDLDEAEIEFGWQVDRHGNRATDKDRRLRSDGADPSRVGTRARAAQDRSEALRARRLRIRDANRQAAATAQRRAGSQGRAGAGSGRSGTADLPGPS
jgi:integrase